MTSLLDRIRDRALKSYADSPLYELHPELASRIPIMRVFSDGAGGDLSSNTFPQNAREYGRSVWVHKSIKVIADNVSPHLLEVVRGSGDERDVIDNHELTKVLNYPNDAMSSADLWRGWVSDMMLGGEEGIEVVRGQSYGGIKQLWTRQPQTYEPIPGKGGKRYLSIRGYKVDDQEGDPYFLEPEEFIHLKFYNPSNPWRGIAPIQAVRMGIVIDQLAQAWSRLFFKNSARPDYAVITEEGLTSKEKDELELKISVDHSGPDGWHKPMIFDQAIKDVKTISHPPKDLEWLEQRKLSRDEIGAIFGVPDEILGFGRDTYENFGTAFRVLWVLTLDPLISFRDVGLTTFFRRFGQLKEDERIETNRSKVPELPEDLAKKFEMLKTLFGTGVPVNMANDRLQLGLPPIPGGDIGYLPLSFVPMSSREEDMESPEDNTFRNGVSLTDRGISTDPVRKWNYGEGAPEYDSDEHKELLKRREVPLSPLTDSMRRGLRKFFQAQENRVLRAVRGSRSLGRGKFKAGEEELLPTVESVFDLAAEIKRFEDEFGPVIAEAVKLSGETEISYLGLEIAFDIDRPEVRGAISGILKKVSEKTNNRIWEELISLFEEAELEGEGIVAIQERLSAYYGGVKSFFQTERIARTTMTGATNAGAQNAWKQSGVVEGSEWVSALLPKRSRVEHMAAHAQFRKLGDAFEVGGELLLYPGDPEGSPGNIINCLCTTAPRLMKRDD